MVGAGAHADEGVVAHRVAGRVLEHRPERVGQVDRPAVEPAFARLPAAVAVEVVEDQARDADLLEIAEDGAREAAVDRVGRRRGRLDPPGLDLLSDCVRSRRHAREREDAGSVGEHRVDRSTVAVEQRHAPASQTLLARLADSVAVQVAEDDPGDVQGRTDEGEGCRCRAAPRRGDDYLTRARVVLRGDECQRGRGQVGSRNLGPADRDRGPSRDESGAGDGHAIAAGSRPVVGG